MEKERHHLLVESVKNITRRSIPIPHPPVGGNPCSSLCVTYVKRKIEVDCFGQPWIGDKRWTDLGAGCVRAEVHGRLDLLDTACQALMQGLKRSEAAGITFGRSSV